MAAETHAPYHHGDLRATLLREASLMLRATGVEGLSMRALAEHTKVSPPALYHHFQDKNGLLCALAEASFRELDELTAPRMRDERASLRNRLSHFVHAYVEWAAANPENYDLIFGRSIWRLGKPTDELRDTAQAVFRKFVDQVDGAMQEAGLPPSTNALRLAQATWAMLHGLCRLRIDGIYTGLESFDEMAEEAVRFLLYRLGIYDGGPHAE